MPATITDRLNGLTTSVSVKPPCVAVATGNVTLAGLQTVGSVALAADDRVLLIGQTDSTENGIYNADSGDWTRAKDFDGARDAVQGTLVLVRNQFIQGAFYELTTANPVNFGSSQITFTIRDSPQVDFPTSAAEVSAAVTVLTESYELIDLRRYGGNPNGTSDSTAAFVSASAVSALGGGNIIVGEGTYRIASNITIAAGATIEFRQGGKVTIDSGKTLTISGNVVAPRTKIFFGTGLVTIGRGKAFPEWWGALGDGVACNPATGTDDVAAINAAVTACLAVDFDGLRTYSIDGNSDPTYSVIGGIKPRSGTRLSGNGATIQVKTSTQIGYGCINCKQKTDLLIEDFVLIGDLDAHGATGGEFGHGLLFEGCDNVTVRNVNAKKFWGDGCLFNNGSAPLMTPDENNNISLYDCVFDDNRRDAMSVTAMRGLRVYNSQMINTGATAGTSPISGIDFEPDDPSITVDDCLFIGCTITGNLNQGVLKAVFPSTNITFIKCNIASNGAFALLDQQTGSGQVFIDCTFNGPALAQNTFFTECDFSSADVNSSASLYSLSLTTDTTSRLDNCTITANESQRLALITSSSSELTRKVLNDCSFVQNGNSAAGGTSKFGVSDYVTLRGCKFLHLSSNPTSQYTFNGGPFDGIKTKIQDCWIDYYLGGSIAMAGLVTVDSPRGGYSSAPTTGTHRRGQAYWFLTPSTGAAPGCVCTISGTFSAFSDVTGDTTNGSATVAGMASTTGLAVGEFVSCSAGFATTGPFEVIALTTTTVTLDTASNATVANITVSTPDPVFKNMANLA